MPQLSAVLIVKNEVAILAACLAMLDWVDEIVVLDGGSGDDTVNIARQLIVCRPSSDMVDTASPPISSTWKTQAAGPRTRTM